MEGTWLHLGVLCNSANFQMTEPRNITIQDYDYDLPADRIAVHPVGERSASKLLIYDKGTITSSVFDKLEDIAHPDTHFFLNDTRVIHARIIFEKSTGGTIEVFLLAPLEGEFSDALIQTASVKFRCYVGGAKKWKEKFIYKKIILGNIPVNLGASIISRDNDIFDIELFWNPWNFTFADILDLLGQVPLPPYINRDVAEEDEERYQTVFASKNGSVAAPTAGLHFTDEMLALLTSRGATVNFLTLHVSAGTFKPVTSTNIGGHLMHREYFEIKRDTIRHIIKCLDEKIIAVGTTTLRTLESLYWLGEKCRRGEPLNVEQWDPYDFPSKSSVRENLELLIQHLDQTNEDVLRAHTSLLIVPGYSFKIVTGLITNFHMPGSTLLLLVSAFVGDDWQKIYRFALDNDYRFLSYGDTSLLLP